MLGTRFLLARDVINNKLAEKFPICEDGYEGSISEGENLQPESLWNTSRLYFSEH